MSDREIKEYIVKTRHGMVEIGRVQEIVRCKDCRYGQYCTDGETTYQCFKWNSGEFGMLHEQNWFCADGSRGGEAGMIHPERRRENLKKIEEMDKQKPKSMIEIIKETEYVMVVRCKDCDNKECWGRAGDVVCGIDGTPHRPNWFCADGERRNK